jgi:hypothetical protein
VSRFSRRDLDGKYINYTSLACTNDGINISARHPSCTPSGLRTADTLVTNKEEG